MGLELDPVLLSSSMMKMPKKTAVGVGVMEVQPERQMKKVQMMFDEAVKAMKMTRAWTKPTAKNDECYLCYYSRSKWVSSNLGDEKRFRWC